MSVYEELKRRNVFRVAIAYVIAAWLLLQVTEVLVSLLELPPVVGKAAVAILVIGFLPTVVIAWVYELTPDGLRRDSDVDRSRSIAPRTGRRLNVLIIAMLIAVAAYFAWESRFMERAPAEITTAPGPIATPTTGPAESLADEQTSIAVLPFTNMSADADNEYFADGLSEEILNQLAQVPELRVIARTSSFAFKGEHRDLRDIGATLGAGHILEGSVRRQGDRVRITAQLIETGAGGHLWSKNFDRQLDDIFQIQDEIASEVVKALNIVLDEEARQAMLTAGVRNVDAFVAYQRGYELYIDAHAHSTDQMFTLLEEGNAWFERAIEAAPDFADAYARKTDLYAHHALDSHETDHASREAAIDTMLELWDTAYELAREPNRRRVIDIDRTFFSDDWSRLPRLLDEAVASDSCANGNWMELALPFADHDGMLDFYRQATRCDPLMLLNYGQAATLNLLLGQVAQAENVIARGRALGGEHRWLSIAELPLALARTTEAALLEQLESELAEEGPSRRNLARQTSLLAAMGRTGEARQRMQEFERLGPLSLNSQIQFHAWLGDRAAANEGAAALDALPGGTVELVRVVNNCECGAPFDLEATPRLRARIAEAGFAWPPESLVDFPAKDW